MKYGGVVVALACVMSGCARRVPAPVQQHGLPLAWSAAQCFAPVLDADGDGVDDNCELAAAAAFAPLLAVNPSGCNWNPTAEPPRLNGGYFFAAERVDGGLRIAYLPAYFRDCGWHGAKCVLPGIDCSAHAGDSEMIILDVGEAAGRWRTMRVFLSAHCFGRSGGSCRWYEGDELSAFAWHEQRTGGAPVVWVAEGRQANYASWRDCDAGHHAIDTCDHSTYAYRFPVRSNAQNVGSALRPIGGNGCVPAEQLPLGDVGTSEGAVECFWSARPFRGWNGDGAGATAYVRYLRDVAGF